MFPPNRVHRSAAILKICVVQPAMSSQRKWQTKNECSSEIPFSMALRQSIEVLASTTTGDLTIQLLLLEIVLLRATEENAR